MTINEMISKYRIRKGWPKGNIEIGKARGISDKEVEMLKAAKPAILAELDRREEEKRAAEKAAIDNIENGSTTINVKWRQGSPLSGYSTDLEASKLLVDVGAAKEVGGWGILVDDGLVKTCGKEFTLPQALEYVAKRDAEKNAAKAAAAKEIEDKFRQAKETGERVLVKKWTTGCSDPTEECDMDLVYEWAMPDGKTEIVIQHTW